MVKIKSGDIIFFIKHKPILPQNETTTFIDAVCAGSIIDSYVFHTGLFVGEEGMIIHATPTLGVVKELFIDAAALDMPTKIEVYRLKCSVKQRQNAVIFAHSILGSEYNDIFSPNCINSKKKKAFYCCQLITEAYGRQMFNPHTLNFLDKNGNFIDYWIKYFEERKEIIPQGLSGSHPSIIKSSECLSLIKTFENENGKWIEKENAPISIFQEEYVSFEKSKVLN